MHLKTLLALLLVGGTTLCAQRIVRPIKEVVTGSIWYWTSVAAMAGGSAFDAGTSVRLNQYASANGLHETNPILANSQGKFVPARGIAVKVAVLGATVGCERLTLLLLRKQTGMAPTIERIFSWVNVGFAAGYTGIAAHNMSLR